VGLHQTTNLADGYLGSGTKLKKDIKKFGKDAFSKEILEFFKTEDAMIFKEEELVTRSFIKENNVYNIMPGGKYGSAKRNGLSFEGKTHTLESKLKISKNRAGITPSDKTRAKLSKNNFARRDPARQKECASRGGKHSKSIDHRLKISKSLTGKTRNTTTVICPYCGTIGKRNGMTRWHFDNCKKK